MMSSLLTTILVFAVFVVEAEVQIPEFKEKYPQAGFVKPLPNWRPQHAGHVSNGWYEGHALPLNQQGEKTSGELLPPTPPQDKCPPGACCNEDETLGCLPGPDGSCCEKDGPKELTPEDILPPKQLRDYRKAEIPPGFQQMGKCEPKPTCITPSKGPSKGGVRITIQGDFMTSSVEDIDQVMVCGAPCVEIQVETFDNCTGPEAEKEKEKEKSKDAPCWIETLPYDENGQRTHQKHVYLYRQKTHKEHAAQTLCLTTMTRYPDGRETFCETCALQSFQKEEMYRKLLEDVPVCTLHDVPKQSCNEDIISESDSAVVENIKKKEEGEVEESGGDEKGTTVFIAMSSLDASAMQDEGVSSVSEDRTKPSMLERMKNGMSAMKNYVTGSSKGKKESSSSSSSDIEEGEVREGELQAVDDPSGDGDATASQAKTGMKSKLSAIGAFMSKLKKEKTPEENRVGEEESQDFERTCSKICVPSEDLQPDISESLNQYAGSQLVSISNALNADKNVVEGGERDASELEEEEEEEEEGDVEDEGTATQEPLVEVTTQEPLVEVTTQEPQVEDTTQKPSMLQKMKNGLSAMKSYVTGSSKPKEDVEASDVEGTSSTSTDPKSNNLVTQFITINSVATTDNRDVSSVTTETVSYDGEKKPSAFQKFKNFFTPKNKEPVEEAREEENEQCPEAKNVHECRVTCGCPNEEDKELVEKMSDREDELPENPERLCISVCSDTCVHDPEAQKNGITTVPFPIDKSDTYIKVGNVDTQCGECATGCTLCCPSCKVGDPVNDEEQGMTSLDEVCATIGSVVSGGFKMSKDYSQCTCEIPCETVCASSTTISQDEMKRCKCEVSAEKKPNEKKDKKIDQEELPEHEEEMEEEEEMEGQDLEKQMDMFEQYKADKLAGKTTCKGGETKRNLDYEEQRVEKEESIGTCIPREVCELTPTETRNGASGCEDEPDGVMCCSKTVCQVGSAKGYCGIKDKCIEKGLIPVSDMVYKGLAVGCRHLPDDIMCCVHPNEMVCVSNDKNQYQGRCSHKLSCEANPMGNAVLKGMKDDVTCAALDEALTCCVDNVPCSGTIDASLMGECMFPATCEEESRKILKEADGCDHETTNLICCLIEEEQDDSNKCDENDLQEIQKTRPDCTTVIGGIKRESKDGTMDYRSCMCEEIEECTSFSMNNIEDHELETLLSPCDRDDATFDGGTVSKRCRVSPLEEDPNSCVGCFVANNRCTYGASPENANEIRCSKCLVEKDFSKCTCTSLCKEEDLNEVLMQMPGRDPLCSLPHAKIKTDSILRNSDFATCKCEVPCSDKDIDHQCFDPTEKISRCGSHPHKRFSPEMDVLCAQLCVYDEVEKKCANFKSKDSDQIKGSSSGPYEFVGGLIVGIPWCEIHCSPHLSSRGIVTGTYFAVGDTAKMDKSNCMCERPCVLSDRAQVKECETIEASTLVDISGTAKISSGGEVNFDRCTCKKLHIQGSDCVLEMEAEARLKAGGKGDEEESDSKGGDEEDGTSEEKIKSGLYCDKIIEEPRGMYSVDSEFWKHFKLPIREDRPGLSVNSDRNDMPLPESWERGHSEEGRTYYYNTKSGDVQWAHPLLPNGWSSTESRKGDPTYWEREEIHTKTHDVMTGELESEISLLKKSPFLCCVTKGGLFKRDKCALVMAEKCPEGALKGNPDTCCKNFKVGYPPQSCAQQKCYEDAKRIQSLGLDTDFSEFIEISEEPVVETENCPRGCATCGKVPQGGLECLSCEHGFAFHEGSIEPFGTCEIVTRMDLFEGRTSTKQDLPECEALKSTSYDCPEECKCCLKDCHVPCTKKSSCTICASEEYELVSSTGGGDDKGTAEVGSCVKKTASSDPDQIRAFSCMTTDGMGSSNPNQAMPVMISVTRTCGEVSVEGTVSYICEADGEEAGFQDVEEPPSALDATTTSERKGICCVEFNAANFEEALEVKKPLLSPALRSHKCLRTEQESCPSGYVKVADHMAFLDKVINCDVHKTEEECNSFVDTCKWKKGLLKGGSCKVIENFCCTYFMKADQKYECLRETCDADISQEQCCVTPKPKSSTVMSKMKKVMNVGGGCSVGRCDLGQGTAFVGKIDQVNASAFKKEGCCRFFIEKRGARQGYCSDSAESCEPLITRCCVREPAEENEPTTCSVLDVFNTKSVNDNCPSGFRVIEDPVMASKCCSFYSTDGVMMGPCGDDTCVENSSPVSQLSSSSTRSPPPVPPPKIFSVEKAQLDKKQSGDEVAELIISDPELQKKKEGVVEGEGGGGTGEGNGEGGGGGGEGGGDGDATVPEEGNNKKNEKVEGFIGPPGML